MIATQSVCSRNIIALLFLALLSSATGIAAARARGDPNLPVDYLERILTFERSRYPKKTITNFLYQDPVHVRLPRRNGKRKRTVTAVEVFFTPQPKGSVSFTSLNRCVLFAKGVLLKDVVYGDPSVDWTAEDPPAPSDPNLPVDYRQRMLEVVRRGNRNFNIDQLEYSDPVHVRVHEAAMPGVSAQMSAVVFEYGPYDPSTGSPFLMIVSGAALFSKGKFVRIIGSDDKTVEWINGRPEVRPDATDGRSAMAGARRSHPDPLFDPATGPAMRRSIRRQIWRQYGEAFRTMALPPETIAKLVDLIEAKDEARRKALFEGEGQGLDPYSAQMNLAIAANVNAAGRALKAFFGKERLARLELLVDARGYFSLILENGGSLIDDLNDAGIPLTPEQIAALGRICAEVFDPKRNPAYRELAAQAPDRITGISALTQELIDRATRVLSPGQVRVLTLYCSDAANAGDWTPAARGRWARYTITREYGPALCEMKLPAPEIAEAKILLLKRNKAVHSAFANTRAKGENPRSEEANPEVKRAYYGRLKILLGPSGLDRLEQLREILRYRALVVNFEGIECQAEGCPLTDDQIRALGKLCWEARKAILLPRHGTLNEPVDPKTGLTAWHSAILARASSFLTPRQREVLRTLYLDEAVALKRTADHQPLPANCYPPAAL